MKVTIEKNDSGMGCVKVHGYVQLDVLIIFLSKYYPDFTWKDVYICEDLPEAIPAMNHAKELTTGEEANQKLDELIDLFKMNIAQNRTK